MKKISYQEAVELLRRFKYNDDPVQITQTAFNHAIYLMNDEYRIILESLQITSVLDNTWSSADMLEVITRKMKTLENRAELYKAAYIAAVKVMPTQTLTEHASSVRMGTGKWHASPPPDIHIIDHVDLISPPAYKPSQEVINLRNDKRYDRIKNRFEPTESYNIDREIKSMWGRINGLETKYHSLDLSISALWDWAAKLFGKILNKK